MEYRKRLRRVFATDVLGTYDEKRSSFVLAFSGGEQSRGLWVANLLLFFNIKVTGSRENQDQALL